MSSREKYEKEKEAKKKKKTGGALAGALTAIAGLAYAIIVGNNKNKS